MNVPPVDGQPLAQRHCGRCQCAFEADPDLLFQTDWSLCPACAEVLLPSLSSTPLVFPVR